MPELLTPLSDQVLSPADYVRESAKNVLERHGLPVAAIAGHLAEFDRRSRACSRLSRLMNYLPRSLDSSKPRGTPRISGRIPTAPTLNLRPCTRARRRKDGAPLRSRAPSRWRSHRRSPRSRGTLHELAMDAIWRASRYARGCDRRATTTSTGESSWLPCHRSRRPRSTSEASLLMSIAIDFSNDFRPPDWIKLLPAGEIETRDTQGPFYASDPRRIIALTRDASPDGVIVIDIDHSIDFAAPKGARSPAAGYVSRFSVRNGGEVWGRVEWTARGKRALMHRKRNGWPRYGYISPVFEFDHATWEVGPILRAGLTDSPNLMGMAVATNSARGYRKMESKDVHKITTAERQIAARFQAKADNENF
jgi:hypothetical protein